MRWTSACTRARVYTARDFLSCTSEARVVVLDLAISFEGHPAHDRVLDNDDDDVGTLAPDADILKQAGGKQHFQRFVDLGGIVGVAWGEGQIGADRLRVDPLLAFDADILDSALSARAKIAEARAKTQRERDGTQHKEGRKQPSGQRPPHHCWCLPL